MRKTETTEVILLRAFHHTKVTQFLHHTTFSGATALGCGQRRSVSVGWSLFLEPDRLPTSTIHKPLQPTSLWGEKYNRPQRRKFTGRWLKALKCVEGHAGVKACQQTLNSFIKRLLWPFTGFVLVIAFLDANDTNCAILFAPVTNLIHSRCLHWQQRGAKLNSIGERFKQPWPGRSKPRGFNR